MSINAKFQADFDSFHTEATKAADELGKISVNAGTAEKAVNNLASTSTNIGQLASNTQQVANQQEKVVSTTDRMTGSLRQFDSLLGSVGVHVSTQIGALKELGEAGEKGAGQIGALGAAGLVVGTAIAAWEFGRAVAHVLGLDEAITHLTGSAQELKTAVEGAKFDTINKAIEEGAKKTISYAEAVDFLRDKQRAADKAQRDYTTGVKALDEAGTSWQKTLDTIDGRIVDAIKQYLDLKVSQKDIAAAYGLTEAQVRAVAEARRADIESMRDQQAMDKATFELAQDHQRKWREEIDKTKDERNKAVIEGLTQIKGAEAELGEFFTKQALSTTDYQILQINRWRDEQLDAFKGTEEQYKVFSANIIAIADSRVDVIKRKEQEVAQAAVQAEIDAINALNAIIPNIGHGPTTPNGEGPAPIVVPPINVPSVFHNLSGINTPTNMTINVNGNVLGSAADVGRAVSDGMTTLMKNQGVRFPSS